MMVMTMMMVVVVMMMIIVVTYFSVVFHTGVTKVNFCGNLSVTFLMLIAT